MDARMVIYGETALDKLLQWLRAAGEPKDIDTVVRQYLELLRQLVLEDSE